ncbi:MAG: flippase activity-associated protein Agl23 [Halanaeroarchaeum sp.]
MAQHRRIARALLGVVLVALAMRLAWLGTRVAHWDEARHALRTLQFQQTGVYRYHPVLHGPLLFEANEVVFDLLGPTDATMRLVPALVGAALPAAAWLYRDHLGADEVVGVAVVLAANPILVFYSRFARSDVLVAAFAVAFLGSVLRARATGRSRYALLGGGLLALAAASKENVVLYLAAWLGASTLVALFHPAVAAGDPLGTRVETVLWRVAIGVRTRALAILGGGLLFFATTVALYAPRGVDGPSFADLADPAAIPDVVAASTVRPVHLVLDFWVFGPVRGEHSPLGFLALLAGLLLVGAAATVGLALWTLREEWRSRPLLAFAGLWAAASFVGYPLATDLLTAWIAVHVVVALALPAGVGLARSVRQARRSRGRRIALAAVLAYLLVTVALTSYVAPGARYNPLTQPSQMSGDVRPALQAIETADAPGPEVAYVGPYFDRENWTHRLPFAWYAQRSGADVTAVSTVEELPDRPPPVVIGLEDRRAAMERALPDHRCSSYVRVPWVNFDPQGFDRDTVVCVA